MQLNTIKNIELLLKNAVDFEEREYNYLIKSFKDKYGNYWAESLTKDEKLQFERLTDKVIDIKDIYDDFINQDWR